MFDYAVDQLLPHPGDIDWWVYPFLDASGRLVGSGGYQGPPANGSVEIGYEIAHEFREHRLGAAAVVKLLAGEFRPLAPASLV